MTTLPHVIADRLDIQANFDALNPEAWRLVGAANQPGFENSWVNFDTTRIARFYKDALGRVHLAGYIKNGTALATTAFTLPAGYRPGWTLDEACISNGGLHGMCVIGTNGSVVPTKGATSDFSLSGISFRAEA